MAGKLLGCRCVQAAESNEEEVTTMGTEGICNVRNEIRHVIEENVSRKFRKGLRSIDAHRGNAAQVKITFPTDRGACNVIRQMGRQATIRASLPRVRALFEGFVLPGDRFPLRSRPQDRGVLIAYMNRTAIS
jgi:hypothetical protein